MIVVSSIPVLNGRPLRLLASTDFALRVLMRLAADPARHRSTEALAERFRPDSGAFCLSPDCRLRGVLWRSRGAFLAVLDATTLAACLRSGRLPYMVGDEGL